MRLADFIAPERAVVPLEATDLMSAAQTLLERLVAAGAVANPDRLRARVAEERPEDIVAMGDRAFLLHYRTDAVSEIAVAIGTSPAPICRELGDNDRQCARIALLVVAPPRFAARYLQLVSGFARALARPDAVEQVLAQPTAEALAALPVLTEHEMPEQLTVRDIMTERPRTVRPETLLRDAAHEMVRARVGGLPVVDDQHRVVGMLSERDMLRHLLTTQLLGGPQKAPPPTGTVPRRTVRDVMNRQVLGVSPEQPLAEVASLMSNKDVDRVPVVREGRLVGLLTRGDIVRKLIGS